MRCALRRIARSPAVVPPAAVAPCEMPRLRASRRKHVVDKVIKERTPSQLYSCKKEVSPTWDALGMVPKDGECCK